MMAGGIVRSHIPEHRFVQAPGIFMQRYVVGIRLAHIDKKIDVREFLAEYPDLHIVGAQANRAVIASELDIVRLIGRFPPELYIVEAIAERQH